MHRKFTASTSRLARIFVAVALISLIGVAGAGAARHHASRSAVLSGHRQWRSAILDRVRPRRDGR